jgi:hypothetical protein
VAFACLAVQVDGVRVARTVGRFKQLLKVALKKEKGLMAEFSDFCDDELKEVAYAIETAGAQIQDFQAAIVDARSLVAAKKEFPSDEGLPRGAEAEQRGACLGPVQADRGHHDLP